MRRQLSIEYVGHRTQSQNLNHAQVRQNYIIEHFYLVKSSAPTRIPMTLVTQSFDQYHAQIGWK